MGQKAEEIVQEWLNRDGFFTIRGIRQGNNEADLLAVRLVPPTGGDRPFLECRHVEVQVSFRPVSYLAVRNAKGLTRGELELGVHEWIQKKFLRPELDALRRHLFNTEWRKELVVHEVRHQEELEIFVSEGVIIHRFRDILDRLSAPSTVVPRAAGSELVDLALFHRAAAVGRQNM